MAKQARYTRAKPKLKSKAEQSERGNTANER